MKSFWSSLFGRIVRLRYHNETFRMAWPSIIQAFEKRLSPPDKWIDSMVQSEDSAFLFFESEFSRLRPDEQRALSGYTRQEWLVMEKTD